jgi:hypothetical protein
MLLAISLLAACAKRDERVDISRWVTIYPGSPIVELPGERGKITVTVRNVSENKLTGLRLEVKSGACRAVRIEPPELAELAPGDRRSFGVELARVAGLPRQRHPFQLTLRAGGLPVPAGLDLMVDTAPPPEKGWIDVGQVTLVSGADPKRSYYLLAAAPLLAIVGWLLWRWRARRRPPEDPGPRAQEGAAGRQDPPAT